MKTNEPATPFVYFVPRTCARCGQEFRAVGREYLCHICRKPKPKVHKPPCTSLSQREKQVVALIKDGMMNKEIAYALHLTEGTIKEYLVHIFRKLKIRNRVELAMRQITD